MSDRQMLLIILLALISLSLSIWLLILHRHRRNYFNKIFSAQDRSQLLLQHGALEDTENILSNLEDQIQALSWSSTTRDGKKRDLLLKSLYLQSRILMEARQQARETEHQRELLNTTLRSENKERERIAKCIHDECGIVLTSLKMNLNYLLEETDLNPVQKQKVNENVSRLNKLMLTMREITEDLASPSLRLIGNPPTNHVLHVIPSELI